PGPDGPVHGAGGAGMRRGTGPGQPARACLARQPGLLCASARLWADAGPDSARRHRRLPGTGYTSLRLHALVYPFRGCLAGGAHFARTADPARFRPRSPASRCNLILTSPAAGGPVPPGAGPLLVPPRPPSLDGASGNFGTLKSLFPYVWRFKKRVLLALACLVLAKVATVLMPIYLKQVIDALSLPATVLVLPVAALLGYGAVRLASSALGEVRDALFARVTQGSVRLIANHVFRHLLGLSLRFHTERQTGGLSRDIERGTKGISFLLNFLVFNILPTLLEIALVCGILLWRYDWAFAAVTLGTIAAYIVFTLLVTERRMRYRRAMNDLDSRANSRAIDALLNYEPVNYFGNEEYEINRYDQNMGQ